MTNIVLERNDYRIVENSGYYYLQKEAGKSFGFITRWENLKNENNQDYRFLNFDTAQEGLKTVIQPYNQTALPPLKVRTPKPI